MPLFLFAQQLFSVTQHGLSQENVTQLKNQIAQAKISTLSLVRNNESKDVYAIRFALVQPVKFIILNEETGDNVVISPVDESLTELQLAPFFIEEMKQAVLGDAAHYLIVEVNSDLSVKSVSSIPVLNKNILLPRYFYGEKENVKEAFPRDRQIIQIFKAKPQYISAFPDDMEQQHYLEQLAEKESYYVYMYKLSNGNLCTYDEHFDVDNKGSKGNAGSFLEFTLSGSMDAEQRTATEYALELWGEQLAGTVPVDINVTVYDFGPSSSGVLGRSYQQPMTSWGGNIWYCSALGNQLLGYNFSSSNDIQLEMNTGYNWYYGLDSKTPSGKYDYVTVMLHEITHGLGFFSICQENGYFSYSGPSIYDLQLFQGLDGPCLADIPNASDRAALLISKNLYAGAPGSNLLQANGGIRVKIYAPGTFASGSSRSHWDSSVSFPTFMKYSIGSGSANALHTFNNRKMGILLDMGWKLPVVDPNAVWVTFYANGGEGEISPQPFSPGVSKILRLNTFTKKGYMFTSWNSSADGTGKEYADRAPVIISNNLNLYAQWEAKTYTLKFNANGGTMDITSKQVTYDAPIGELPIPVKEGYKFVEWRVANKPINEAMIWNYTEDMPANAVWTLNTGIAENQRTLLQIVPNPANHTIELQITNYKLQNTNIEFYNIFGQLVKSVPVIEQFVKDTVSQKINISDLPAGLYMVKVGDKTVKLVVN